MLPELTVSDSENYQFSGVLGKFFSEQTFFCRKNLADNWKLYLVFNWNICEGESHEHSYTAPINPIGQKKLSFLFLFFSIVIQIDPAEENECLLGTEVDPPISVSPSPSDGRVRRFEPSTGDRGLRLLFMLLKVILSLACVYLLNNLCWTSKLCSFSDELAEFFCSDEGLH